MNSETPLESGHEPRWAGLSEVTKMAWPIIAGSLSFTVMQFVDQALVSRLGDHALAAVGSAGLWSFTFCTFLLGILGCVTTFVGQSYGRGAKENCARYTWQGIYLSLILGALAILLWPVAGKMFQLMGHSEEVTRLEVSYFRVRLLGYFFIAAQGALASFFQSVRHPMIPMWVALIANVVNVVLDVFLIFGVWIFPAWGVAGAAAATVVSLGIQVVLLLWFFLNARYNAEFGTRHTWRFDLAKCNDLFRIGWPNGLTFFLDLFNWTIFTSYVIGKHGPAALAAHTAALALIHLSFMPTLGLNQATAAIVGQYVGEGDIRRARNRTHVALKIAAAYMITVGVLLALYGEHLLVFAFDPSEEVVRLGRVLLVLAAIFQGFDAVNIVLFGALRGAGDTRWTALVAVAWGYGFFLPVAYVFSLVLNYGAIGAWGVLIVYIMGMSGTVALRFRGERWREIKVFSEDRQAA